MTKFIEIPVPDSAVPGIIEAVQTRVNDPDMTGAEALEWITARLRSQLVSFVRESQKLVYDQQFIFDDILAFRSSVSAYIEGN